MVRNLGITLGREMIQFYLFVTTCSVNLGDKGKNRMEEIIWKAIVFLLVAEEVI